MLQFKIFMDKLKGLSYEALEKKYKIPSDSTMIVVINRTAQGRFWKRSVMKGGRDSILSTLDTALFVRIVMERENDINCLSTCEAYEIAVHLQMQRVLKAQKLLCACGCDGLANNIKVQKPHKTWLQKMAEDNGLSVVPPEDLERMRRIACDKTAIREFFERHAELLRRDPRLIFNMDETMVSSQKKFKVVVSNGRTPLSESPQVCPHITACVTIGAAGYVMKPLYIIPNKKTLKGLEMFDGKAFFASSSSGWMNKNIFTYWGILFLTQMSRYRLDLPPELRDKRILLLLDGHKSRVNFFIAMLFDIYGIDILIFPGHTSHLLQAFDVAIASPLKTAYKEFFLLHDLDLEQLIQSLRPKKKLKEVRIMMIKCLNNALSESAILSNIESGFKASGIYPLDINVPLNSKYAMDNSMRERFPNLYEKIKNGNLVNNHHLNGSPENLAYIYNADFHQAPTERNQKIGIRDIKAKVRLLHSCEVARGRALSSVPELIIVKEGKMKMKSLEK